MAAEDQLEFVKMHGIGNDYVFVDTHKKHVDNPSALARRLAPRHFSVGSDGLILVEPSQCADVRMRIFNADGSEAEMCGNGIRCVAKYAYDHGLCRRTELEIETAAGIKEVVLETEKGEVSSVRVDMGVPRLRRRDIPMEGSDADEKVIDEKMEVDGRRLKVTCLSMGNPHCIVKVHDFTSLDWQKLGSALECHNVFPSRTNVHFVKLLSERELEIKTWERGSGATLACGTGASAAAVAMHMLGLTRREVKVHLPGGALLINWCRSTGSVFMTGPAVEVFRGVISG